MMIVTFNRFIVYKLPVLPESRHEVVRRGAGQMYMDVNSQHWQLLSRAVTDKAGHAVYHTLQQIYSGYHSAVCTVVLVHYCLPLASFFFIFPIAMGQIAIAWDRL